MKSRTPILLFAALGLGASLTSTYVHYQLLTNPSYNSFCDVSATVSCTQAYLSEYGSFMGVPVALGGVLYFAAVLVMAALSGRKTKQAGESAPAYIFALSTLALAFVLYLGYASLFVLKTLCLLCATTYVAVIAIFLISGRSTSVPIGKLPARAPRDVKTLVSSPVALIATILVIAGTIGLVSMFPEGGRVVAQGVSEFPPLTDEQKVQLQNWFDLQPKVDVPVPSDGAKVLIVKFNDYQCPPCRSTFENYNPILKKYEQVGGVKFVLKHFPLEPECNAAIPQVVHPAACEAAAAQVMARKKNDGSAEKLEHWLFDHQGPPLLTPDQVKAAARDVAGITDFDAQYPNAIIEVKNDAGMGALIGVKSTPTFVINGHLIAGGLEPRVFDAIIDLELKRTQ